MRIRWLLFGCSAGLACGGVVGADRDATSDAPSGSFNDAHADEDVGFGFDAPVATFDAARYADSPTFPTDAACSGDALAGDAGASFPCGDIACSSGSSYCGMMSGGRIFPLPGCHALPCNCAPQAGCGCLEPLPEMCTCSTDAGGIVVVCNLP